LVQQNTNTMKNYSISTLVRTASTDAHKKIKIKIRLSAGRGLQQIADSMLFVKIGDWDFEENRFKKKQSVKNTRYTLERLIESVDNQFTIEIKKGDIPKDWLTIAVDKFHNPEKYEEKPITLFSFIQDFIDKAENRPKSNGKAVSYKMIREYERTFFYLKEFAQQKGEEPDFNDIDLNFYDEFLSFLQNTYTSVNKREGTRKKKKYKLATNTIGKKIQTLKIFLNDATARGYNKNFAYKHEKFKSISEEAETFYLNEQEIDKLYKKDLSKDKRLERVRDLFIIGCWTGLRFSDLSTLSPQNIKNGFFYVTQKKTGDPVVIPVHPVVSEIMAKYAGKLPPAISNQKFNKYLQEAAQIAELDTEIHKGMTRGGQYVSKKYKKYELLTTHTARRSMATNLYKAGFPSQSIMAITGHRTETAFLKYLKVTEEEHAELLRKHWLNNSKHLKVVS